MKRLFTLLLLSFAALSCEMTDENIDDLLDKRDWVTFAEGTELTVDVPSEQTVLNYHFESALDWEVKTDAEWLEIDPTSGKAGKDIKIQIKVLHNKDKEGRTGYADLTLSNDESYRITINQAGEGDENEDIVVDIPNNQIWYTSTDGKIVEPYSGVDNNYADAHTTFGVNIVSNTYVDGKGVIEFDGVVTIIGDYAFGWCDSLTSVTIPGSVTTIGWGAFDGCSSLTSVTIPDSVTTLGNYAFFDCDSLTSVTIPDSVTTIGYGVFAWCSNLQEFKSKFASEDGRCLIIDGTLNSFAPAGLTEYTIPYSVTTIGSYPFYGCNSLTSVTIPDSVNTIGDGAFRGCSSLQEFKSKFASEDCRCLIIDGVLNSFAPAGLTEYTIPDSVTTLGNYAFAECSSLTSAIIGDSVTTIGYDAFYNCSSLTSVTIGDSVTSIGYAAFYDCESLTSVYCKATTPPAGDDYMFLDNASGRKIYVPMESVEAYKSADGWNEYEDVIVGYDFDRNEEVVQPEQIPNNQIWYTSIDGEIVEPYSGVDNNYADALKTFGVNIVSNSYVDGKGVIEFDGDVTVIGQCGFYNCDSLTSVTIPDSVTKIGYWVFGSCSSLTSVTIPDSITTIGMAAFALCTSLTSVTIPNSITTIDNYAFCDCSSLTSVTIPDSVTMIGGFAFANCSSLTSVTIGDSVTTIGEAAFYNCSSFTSVYCKPTTTPSITVDHNGYWDAFDYNASGRKIYVPMESVEAYKSASGWSEYADDIEGYNF